MAATFERSQLVRWTSQGRGVVRHHVGVVYLVVPAGVPIRGLVAGLVDRFSFRALRLAGGNRSETSYLVAVTEGGKRGKARLHWPHASKLRPYEHKAPAP